ncbi:MAG: Holliday junction branch migration protein RuvA, partial [Pseudooceanicola atlanticus]
GIGPKTAQRIVLELKDKAPTIMAMGGAPASVTPAAVPTDEAEVIEPAPAPQPAPPTSGAAQAEALSALANLGYGPSEAATAVAQAASEAPDADTAALIRSALKRLAPA